MKKFIERIKNAVTMNIFIDICIIAIVVISTLFPTLFDPEHADWKNVLSNFILSVIIMLLAFISQMNSSRTINMKKESYKVSRDAHINKIRDIQEKQLSKMQKLYVDDYNKKSLEEYVKSLFNEYEIPFELYSCKIEIVKLALKKGEIDKNQYSVIKLCRKGKVQYNKFDIKDLISTNIIKKQTNSNKSQQSEIVLGNLLSKLSWMLAFAILLGTMIPNESNMGISNQAWINLASRMLSFVGGMWCGGSTGKEIVEDDIRLFDLFYNFNCQFVQDFENGIWKPREEDINENVVERLTKLYNQENHIKEQTLINADNDDKDEEIQEIEMTEEEYLAYQNKIAK